MMTVCPKCRVFVHDLGKHERRGRCGMQHIRKRRVMK